jgi:hypothetical protein
MPCGATLVSNRTTADNAAFFKLAASARPKMKAFTTISPPFEKCQDS